METNTPSLRDHAMSLYTNRPAYIKVNEISEAIKRTPEWLRLFSKGRIANPGIASIENLIAYINSRTEKGE